MAGIYIHVPFCRQACHYCDFHFSTQTKSADRMVQGMVREAKLRHDLESVWRHETFTTLYLGGGTPSLLSSNSMTTLVRGVTRALGVDMETLEEVTLEANPEDLTDERLEAWREAGITRLSVGIQSFHDDTLRWMNRAHTGKQAEEGILRAHRAGFETLTVDLIYGVPTLREWSDDVKRALDLPVRHLSAYALTVEPKTVLGTRVERGDQPAPSDSRAVQEYHSLCGELTRRRWHHYETSNWAQPNREGAYWVARHNSAYWSGAPYLGLGPGAHGFVGASRYANVSNNPAYLTSLEQGVLNQTTETLSSTDRYNEHLMTGLRTAAGIHPESLEKLWGHRPDIAEPDVWAKALESGDLIAIGNGRFRVPEERWITGDRVAAALFWVDSP